MADEIKSANVVRLVFEGGEWIALIGPDLQSGLAGRGLSAAAALVDLAVQCSIAHWPFDWTWKPGKTALHDA